MANHPRNLHIPFEQMLIESGAEFAYMYGEYGQGLAYNEKFNIRYDLDEIEIGVKATFDRWANSRDYVCSPLPRGQEDFDALWLALEEAVKTKRCPSDFSAIDIWPLLKKVKRAKRKEAHDAAKLIKTSSPGPTRLKSYTK